MNGSGTLLPPYLWLEPVLFLVILCRALMDGPPHVVVAVRAWANALFVRVVNPPGVPTDGGAHRRHAPRWDGRERLVYIDLAGFDVVKIQEYVRLRAPLVVPMVRPEATLGLADEGDRDAAQGQCVGNRLALVAKARGLEAEGRLHLCDKC